MWTVLQITLLLLTELAIPLTGTRTNVVNVRRGGRAAALRSPPITPRFLPRRRSLGRDRQPVGGRFVLASFGTFFPLRATLHTHGAS